MRKPYLFSFSLLACLYLAGCNTLPTFQTPACAKPVKQAPTIDNATIIEYAKMHFNLIPSGNELTVILPTDIFFKRGLPALQTNKDEDLDQLIVLLKKYGPAKIKIAGFTDNVANPQQNQLTSEQQARSLATYLWTHGIATDQIYAVGYGDHSPVADNATSTGSNANRRIVISLKTQCTI
jgi:outer membrane protein OmpA-like peptidoglycan-associated protein